MFLNFMIRQNFLQVLSSIMWVQIKQNLEMRNHVTGVKSLHLSHVSTSLMSHHLPHVSLPLLCLSISLMSIYLTYVSLPPLCLSTSPTSLHLLHIFLAPSSLSTSIISLSQISGLFSSIRSLYLHYISLTNIMSLYLPQLSRPPSWFF